MVNLADFILCGVLHQFAFDDLHKVLACCHPVFMRHYRYWRHQSLNQVMAAAMVLSVPPMIEVPKC